MKFERVAYGARLRPGASLARCIWVLKLECCARLQSGFARAVRRPAVPVQNDFTGLLTLRILVYACSFQESEGTTRWSSNERKTLDSGKYEAIGASVPMLRCQQVNTGERVCAMIDWRCVAKSIRGSCPARPGTWQVQSAPCDEAQQPTCHSDDCGECDGREGP